MDKSPDAFRTISEVSVDLDLPQHVLRFWESRFSPIRPLKRAGGRRYYRPDDVELLKGIRHLLYGQGYTIKGVQRILKQDGPRFVQAIGRGDATAARASGADAAELATEAGDAMPDRVGSDDVPTPDTAGQVPLESEADRGWVEDVSASPGVDGPTLVIPADAPRLESSAPLPAGLSDEDRAKLEGALADLLACLSLLVALRQG